jgi:circadian clock protein KaiB
MADKRPSPKATARRSGRTAPAATATDPLPKAVREQDSQHYVLRLYVTGLTPTSTKAIERVRAICEQYLHGRYELQVIDIHQLPSLARDEQIIATPTLIKVLPAPLRRFIGNLSNVEKVLFGLDLRPRK